MYSTTWKLLYLHLAIAKVIYSTGKKTRTKEMYPFTLVCREDKFAFTYLEWYVL